VGPHQIGPANVGGNHSGQPYGNYSVLGGRDAATSALVGPYLAANYKYSPLIPTLSLLQMNAWADYKKNDDGSGELRTHTQLWTSHYNPYNIGMIVAGDRLGTGPRVIHFPQVKFTVGDKIVRQDGLHGKRQ